MLFKKNKPATTTSSTSEADSILSIFERDLIQATAIVMHQMNITSQPMLKVFTNDQNLFNALFVSRTTLSKYVNMMNSFFDTYMTVIGSHSLGMGAYVACCQGKYKKTVDRFSAEEVREVVCEIGKMDVYELALNTLGIPVDSMNKKCIDNIILTAKKTAFEKAGSKMKQTEYLERYMHTLYNAGITLVLRG